MKTHKLISPQTANTYKRVSQINYSKKVALLEEISVCSQLVYLKAACPKTGQYVTVQIPKSSFNKMIKWYLKPQKIQENE